MGEFEIVTNSEEIIQVNRDSKFQFSIYLYDRYNMACGTSISLSKMMELRDKLNEMLESEGG